ncbi:hypothetical protein C4D60_Mb07t08400 [Musa balbisiana]|uniref:Uncharacterized protein n=1 Tax=Musa balbisiana TaxID=52838 RepID=A0A4S8JDU3_MUSBA|nr:hypothetical protein C4D60_Mb07t08400 [Musa balbisiana]
MPPRRSGGGGGTPPASGSRARTEGGIRRPPFHCTPTSGGPSRPGATSLGFLPVEVAVATAGGAAECVERPLLARRHELPAPVHRMPPDPYRVILQALPIPNSASAAVCLPVA